MFKFVVHSEHQLNKLRKLYINDAEHSFLLHSTSNELIGAITVFP